MVRCTVCNESIPIGHSHQTPERGILCSSCRKKWERNVPLKVLSYKELETKLCFQRLFKGPTSLESFADQSIAYLKDKPCWEASCILADHVDELRHDKLTAPFFLHKLPKGFEYTFSGFYGHYLNIVKVPVVMISFHRRLSDKEQEVVQ